MISALIADDSPAELEMILYLIRSNHLPIQAATAEDGEEALLYIRNHSVDLLITDIRMPFLDGLSLCRKALEIHPDITIVITSGYDEFSYAREAISLNVTEYLLKPIEPSEFIRLMKHIIGKIQVKKGILFMITTDAQNYTTLHSLDHRICGLAQRFFQAPTKCTAMDHFLLLEISRPCSLSDEPGLLQAETECFLKELQSVFLFPFRGAGIPMPKSEDLLTAVQNMKKMTEESKSCASTAPETGYISEKIRFVCDYIASHYQENIGLSALADITCFHPDYLSRIFKKETGMNLNHYIKVYRLNQACRLLESTQQKIVTISASVGYPNCSYFIRSFTDHFGISPEKYRQQYMDSHIGETL